MNHPVRAPEPAEIGESRLDRPCQVGRVLVVDDDAASRGRIVRCFTEHRSFVMGCHPGDAMHHIQGNRYHLVVVNLGSDRSGDFVTLRRIRARSDIPVILIKAPHLEAVDCVVGLELGADDVIDETFTPRELVARARAILRRQELGRRSITAPGPVFHRFAGWELSRSTRVLKNRAGDIVRLSRREHALLAAFVEAPRRPLSRVQLLRATGSHEDCFDRSIDVLVLRLRRKLEADPSAPVLIRTERGLGYVFDATVEVMF